MLADAAGPEYDESLLFVRRHLLWIGLFIQALLLGWRLDLLPMWVDERFTLETARRSPAGLLEALRIDVHPPVYYFLMHAWLKLPLPGSELLRARALSVLLALLATVLFDRLWLRRVDWDRRALFLGLWVFSPCLLLYARMARSYTLQMTLAMVAIRMARDWLQEAASRKAMARYVAAETLLLYAHYLPALAIAAGTAALGLWRRQWRHFAALTVIALLYAPWITVLAQTTGRVLEGRPYWLGANVVVENLLKVSYVFVAFNFGETLPVWGMVMGGVLLPALLWTLARAWRQTERPPALFLLVAVAGYFVAASWVSFAFVGARLLFLLPFYYLFLLRGVEARRRHGAVVYLALLVIAAGSLASYYRRQDFLNKGYLVDFEEIAGLIKERSRGERALVILDRYATGAGYYLHDPGIPFPIEVLDDSPEALARARYLLRTLHPTVAWHVRYSRDWVSGAGAHLDAEWAHHWILRHHWFVPYSALDRKALAWLGSPAAPTHVVEVVELRPPHAPAR